MSNIKNSLVQSHQLIEKIVKPGDIVIDATAGNGNDTVFLAGLIGKEGRVYSFDIQEKAIQKTKKRLEAVSLTDRVTLIKDGHQYLDKYVSEKVKAIMFNLGYLPGGDHNLGTRAETTIEAIIKSMEAIVLYGVISIVVYHGGDSGFDERDRVMEFLKSLDAKKFTVMKTEFINQINCPPILIFIEKIAQ